MPTCSLVEIHQIRVSQGLAYTCEIMPRIWRSLFLWTQNIPTADSDMENNTTDEKGEPRLSRTYDLNMVGDWGGANFHRICAWLTQAFCDRAGPGSRTSIRSLRDGGMDCFRQLDEGSADLAIATPAGLVSKVVAGDAPFHKKMPHIRAIAVLPQNDRMVFAIHPKYDVQSFEQLRTQKPALRIATSCNDGTNFIGYVADEFLSAHDISVATLKSWGATIVTRTRPEQCAALVETGECDALLQEAIMTPWWRHLVDSDILVPLPSEVRALERLERSVGLPRNDLPAGYWDSVPRSLPALDFSDFAILVRDDMPVEVAYLLTWCLVETRNLIEKQYSHIQPERSGLSYPLNPRKMAKTPIELHPGAREYYLGAGLL